MLDHADIDFQIRTAAMARLSQLRDAGGGVVSSSQLDTGFEFGGERIALWSSQKGIWKPRQLNFLNVALTVTTAPKVEGRAPAYDDEIADDRGSFGYKYQGTDAEHWSNVAVRNAKLYRRPLIYLYGIAKGVYEPIFPVYIVQDDPSTLTFRLQVDVSDRVSALSEDWLEVNAPRREYQTVAVKRRVHQHRFRELVLNAYTRRCAICELRHASLLDAAHIREDRDERGLPEISNGLTLCKIHHSAYDANILGISPELRVHVRDDILREIDGPMLEHGLKAMAGRALRVPRRESWRPNLEFLDERFGRFRSA